jgi:alkylation response protein AidB-like acyl-CoA dehydrogenase
MQDTINYCKERTVFKTKICAFQSNAHRLAEMASELEAAQALVYHCADMVNRGISAIKEVSMCKLICGNLAIKATDLCLQLHGGYGYIEEYNVCRAYRDVRLVTIGGGTNEVMREIIARMMGLYS